MTAVIDKALLATKYALLPMFAALLLLKALTTLNWRMEHDTPLLHYAAFLMDKHHKVPYRDIFETSMPGTLTFHYLIGKIIGYGDFAFHCVDLILLATLLAATYIFCCRFQRSVAISSSMLFGLVYLSMGPTMSLQRDYLGVIPVAFALLCIPAKIESPVSIMNFVLIGLLFGMSVLVKPHLGIGFPIVLGTLLVFRKQSQWISQWDLMKCAGASCVSFLIPFGVALGWLAAHSATSPFINMVFNYLPLHNSLTGDHESISAPSRMLYLLKHTVAFRGFGALLVVSAYAYCHAMMHRDKDKASVISLGCLGLCTLAYALYPTLAGKFWDYHYMPFAYFGSISAGLCLLRRPSPVASAPRAVSIAKETLALAALVTAVTVQLPLSSYVNSLCSDLHSRPLANIPIEGRVDEMAFWLRERLDPGDTVQPLDWTGGSIHAMLLARAKLATQFMYDYHFYHHVSTPLVQELRLTFISQMRSAQPRFIIKVTTNRPWLAGIDTTREFLELHQFISDGYAVAFKGKGYLIYERNDDKRHVIFGRIVNGCNASGFPKELRLSSSGNEQARLETFDVGGRRIRKLFDEHPKAAVTTVTWDGRDDRGREVPWGVYWAQLSAGCRSSSARTVVMR